MNDARQTLNQDSRKQNFSRPGGIWGGGAITLHILADLETKSVSSKDLLHSGQKCLPWIKQAGNQGNHQNFDPSLLPKKL